MPGLDSEQKKWHGKLLVLLALNLSLDSDLKYCEMLLALTKSTLMMMGKYTEYEKDIVAASSIYRRALKFYETPPAQQGWIKMKVKECCFDINMIVFPIAQKEGVFELSEEALNVSSFLNLEGNLGGE